MSTHVSLEVRDGRTVACKRATGPDGAARLAAEADRLRRLDHPGVVRLVELREGPDGPVLVTEYVGPRSIDSAGVVAAERAARLIAHLAETLADLHASGTLHGRVTPDHVLVAGEATVLCSPTVDPGRHHPADDVAGAGRCLLALLAPDLEAEPIPDRRPWRRHRWHGYRHRSLLTLADLATADEPGRRPSARAFADGVAALAGRGEADVRRQPAPATPTPPTVLRAVGDRVVLWLRPPRRRAGALAPPLIADLAAHRPTPATVVDPVPPGTFRPRRSEAALAAPARLVVELGPEPPPRRLVVDLTDDEQR